MLQAKGVSLPRLSQSVQKATERTIHQKAGIILSNPSATLFCEEKAPRWQNVTRASTKWHGACLTLKSMNGCTEVLEQVEVATPPIVAATERKSAPIRIWLVDDNSSFRGLLANLLEEETDFEIERQFPSPVPLLRALEEGTTPDGLDAVRPIKTLAKGTHVMMLTTFSAPGCREQAFRDGASDFMMKTWPITEINNHIRQAMEFGSVAGLLTSFFAEGRPVQRIAETKEVALMEKSSGFDRWLAFLRGLMQFIPS